MPKILDKAVERIKAGGASTKSAWPIAVASLQKAGDIKKGHLTATQKGAKRGAMTPAAREASRKK